MKVSDYIVAFLADKGITDVFGYPGGMVTHLMDSFSKEEHRIHAHINYHEQGAAFCACGYAQSKGIPGVAYATSGPGATNLITGIANAWFDSIPTIFLTGQVNTFEAKGNLGIRQSGFQETDIVSMVSGITKYSVYVSNIEDIRYELEKAWYYANEGRKGPVLLDLPMNIQRAEIEPDELKGFFGVNKKDENFSKDIETFGGYLKNAERPVLLIGAGIKLARAEQEVRKVAEKWKIPIISSMIAFDVFSRKDTGYYGFIGAYGDRTANFIAAKSDLIISIGSRLDIRQVGAKTEGFGTKAKLVRVDIDKREFSRKIKEDELEIHCDIHEFLEAAEAFGTNDCDAWIETCKAIREKLEYYDERTPNKIIREFSHKIPGNVLITTDVGQNQVWIAQSFEVKKGQKVLFSGGHGAMGYSLPAAIGAYYGSRRPVVCFNGDGGIQMNIQELQFISRERLPITIVILNNFALGMIRHFQEMYFESNYYQTMKNGGYTVPEFEKIAYAYDLKYHKIITEKDAENLYVDFFEPQIVEICLENPTYVFPKLEYGKPNQDQEPLLERGLYNYLMEL